VVTVPDGAAFAPATERIRRPNRLDGGVDRGGKAKGYALELDSPTAVRALNELVGAGADAAMATAAFGGGPAGTVIFGGDRGTKRLLARVGRERGLTFRRLASGALPPRQALDGVPRICVLYNPGNFNGLTDVWSLEQLGFEADAVTLAALAGGTNPLAACDVLFNSAVGSPGSDPTATGRLSAFFADGGGYLGGQAAGAGFLASSGQVTGLTAASDSGDGSGYSGIVLWDNTGGADSVITGAYPATDTAIVDPPTWLTGVPSTMTVDGRFVEGDFFLSGLFPGAESSEAAGSAIIAHGSNTSNTARLVVWANNPLYRADPEREWPMVGSGTYWAAHPPAD
jgi:hypothetical protein